MAVLGAVVGATVFAAKWTVFPMLLWMAVLPVASPLTMLLVGWAGLGVLYDKLIIPDRNVTLTETGGIGALTALVLSSYGRFPNPAGRVM